MAAVIASVMRAEGPQLGIGVHTRLEMQVVKRDSMGMIRGEGWDEAVGQKRG